jgi:tetratricopeptide (TPR) repeat protein
MKQIISAVIIFTWCLGTCAVKAQSDSPTPQELARQIIAAYQSGHAGQLRASLPADVPVFENALKDSPNDPLIHFALALCNLGQNQKEAALANFEIAYKNSNDDASIGALYALALKMNRQPLKAYELDKEMIATHPDVPQLQISLAALDITIQKYDEAIAILEALQQKAPANLAPQDKSALSLMQGTCYLYQGNHAKAIEALENSQSITPNMAVDLTVLGEAYLKNGDLEKAGATLDKALAVNPQIPSALYYKAVCDEKAGNTNAAQKHFQDAYLYGKQRLRDNGEDYYLMYLTSQKLAKNDEAITYKAEAGKLLFTYEAP